MSEQQNHKLIHFEVPPPDTIWESIAQRLDDDNRYAVIAHKLEHFEVSLPAGFWSNIAERVHDDNKYTTIISKFENFEVDPPSDVWNNINTYLKKEAEESSSFTQRLQYFEATPPASAWKNISTSLEEDQQLNQLANRLHNFSAMPPENAWQNIVNTLSAEAQTPVIKLNKSFYRISAAAIVIGIMIGGWFLMNSNTSQPELAKNTPGQPSSNKKENASVPDKAKEEIKHQDQPVASNKQTTTSHNTHDTKKEVAAESDANKNEDLHTLKHAEVNDLVAFQKTPINIKSSPLADNKGNVIRDIDVLTSHSYVMVMGPNGQQTRVSSKFANFVRLMEDGNENSAKEYIDGVLEKSDYWKKLFQEWRNKVLQSSYIPSSSNFLDIVEFKDLIQEKQ